MSKYYINGDEVEKDKYDAFLATLKRSKKFTDERVPSMTPGGRCTPCFSLPTRFLCTKIHNFKFLMHLLLFYAILVATAGFNAIWDATDSQGNSYRVSQGQNDMSGSYHRIQLK
jgi:hypothetical protein